MAMIKDSSLDTSTEDCSSYKPPRTASILTSSIPKDVPSRTPSLSDTQTSTTSSPTLPPISELALDDNITLQPLPFASLHDSKHNPDFRVRNHAKVLKLSAIVSGFQSLLQSARRDEDQSALDCLHAQVLKAADGLVQVAQSSLEAQIDSVSGSSDQSFCEVIQANKDGEWYMVQHGDLESDGPEHDVLATKRLQRARKAYEAALDEESSDSESNGGACIGEEKHSETQETTLVEDSPKYVALPHAASSATLDGSHAQASPEPVVVNHPDFLRAEVLQRAADFLEAIQRGNIAVMNEYGITPTDRDIAEAEASVSEAFGDIRDLSGPP